VWSREQDGQKIKVFATQPDATNRELVFTRIDKSGVGGYPLIPTENTGKVQLASGGTRPDAGRYNRGPEPE
jgi:hypothetical protein